MRLAAILGAVAVAALPFACDAEPTGSGGLPGDVPRVSPADASGDERASDAAQASDARDARDVAAEDAPVGDGATE